MASNLLDTSLYLNHQKFLLMPSLNFIGGEKGGVGKSVAARLLAQYFIDRGQPFTGFDTDRSHTSFTRFYADYAAPVIVDTYEGLDQIAAVFEEPPVDGKAKSVIVDLAAQTAAPLSRWGTDFTQLDQSAALKKALALGAHVITLAQLHEGSMRKIDRRNASYWAAVHTTTVPDSLGMLERQRVKTWLKGAYSALDTLPLM